MLDLVGSVGQDTVMIVCHDVVVPDSSKCDAEPAANMGRAHGRDCHYWRGQRDAGSTGELKTASGKMLSKNRKHKRSGCAVTYTSLTAGWNPRSTCSSEGWKPEGKTRIESSRRPNRGSVTRLASTQFQGCRLSYRMQKSAV